MSAEIKDLIEALKRLEREGAKRDKMSAKQSAHTLDNSTDRQRGKLRENLNWQCMEVEKRRIDVARLFKGSSCDVESGLTYFNPSGFHEYQY
jgi:hypothetical protein